MHKYEIYWEFYYEKNILLFVGITTVPLLYKVSLQINLKC